MLPSVNFFSDNPPVKTFLSLLALAIPAFASAAPAAPIPVENFVDLDTYANPQLSPDGKHIAVNVRLMRNGRMVPTMSIYSLPQLKHVSTIAMPKFEIPYSYEWVSNERLVVTKGVERGWREEPTSTGEILAVNIDGTDQQYLFGYNGHVESSQRTRYGDDYANSWVTNVPRPLNGHFLLSTWFWGAGNSSLYDIDSKSGIRKLVADIPMKYLNFSTQDNGKPRFASGNADSDDHVQFRWDDASGKWIKRVSTEARAVYRPFAYSADDQTVYVTHSRDGGPHVISREDMATGVRTLLASDPIGDVNTNIQYTSRPQIPFAATSKIGIPKFNYFDDSLPDAKLHKTLSASFPGAVVNFLNYSDDGQRLVFKVTSDRDPGSFYLFDRKTGDASLLFANMEKIDVDLMAERRPISFAARDGLRLTGYLTLPKNADKRKLPLVLLPHGGPFDVTNEWFFDTDAQFLASRGFAVLQINFRGSDERGINFLEAGYREFGGKIIDDLVDGMKWANTQPELDTTRACVYGWGFGGYAALMLPVREPAMFKCAVGFSGMYHLRSRYKQANSAGDKQENARLVKRMGNDAALLDAQSPSLLARRIRIPVMLVHGSNDRTNPIEQAKWMRDALKDVGNPAEWHEEKDEGHGFYDPARRKVFYQNLENFLAKHLGQ
jgi:dipeptidyl aminopeptidase/acylaminoacyl peptidase